MTRRWWPRLLLASALLLWASSVFTYWGATLKTSSRPDPLALLVVSGGRSTLFCQVLVRQKETDWPKAARHTDVLHFIGRFQPLTLMPAVWYPQGSITQGGWGASPNALFHSAYIYIPTPYFPAVALALFVWTHWRRRIIQPGCCPTCGYDLRGNPTAPCPECGRSPC